MSNSPRFRYEEAQNRRIADSIKVGAIVRVASFDPAAMTVDVQPLSKKLEQGQYRSQPPILSVPIAGIKGGGFIFRPWYKPGDIGSIQYIDHDIDKVMIDGKESEPNTERNHSGTDAVFVGGLVTGNAPLVGLPAGALVMGTEDGAVQIAITPSGIQIKGNVTVAGDVIASGTSLKSHVHGGAESGTTGGPQ